jgi:hypothetical protein
MQHGDKQLVFRKPDGKQDTDIREKLQVWKAAEEVRGCTRKMCGGACHHDIAVLRLRCEKTACGYGIVANIQSVAEAT